MKLVRLHINHFGKLRDLTVEFSDGINVISGINESGKTTLHNFISAMLLGLERGRGRAAKGDTFTHYKPWDGGKYGGSITIEKGGITYTIIRDFGPEEPELAIIRDDDGKRLPATESMLAEITAGLTAPLFKNTICVSQLSAGTGKELADELRNHIVNLKTSGSYNLDIGGAVSRLQGFRKKMNGAFNKDAEEVRENLSTQKYLLEQELDRLEKPTPIEEVNKARNAIEEKMGNLEDEAEANYIKRDKIKQKRKLLSKTTVSVILWILLFVFLGGCGALGYFTYVFFDMSGMDKGTVIYGAGFLASLLFFIITAVNLSVSNKCRTEIKLLDKREDEIDKEILNLKNEIIKLSDEREANQKLLWEREKKEEEIIILEEKLSGLSPVLESNARISRETAAINLAISTMEHISEYEFASFGQFLEKLASALINSITGGAYQGLSIGNNLDVTLIKNGSRIGLGSVSSGTLDQVYLAIRLACIGFFWEEENMPLLLDDTFAYYDDSRLERTLTWLSQIYEGQVIIFTCHLREAEILEVLDIPYNLIKM